MLAVAAALLVFTHAADTPFAEWLSSLLRPDTGTSCCGPAEQVYVDSYQEDAAGGFTAVVDGRPISVPPAKVIWTRANPTGRGVLFFRHYDTGDVIFCFIPWTGV
jgi:hypothetical protein